jgi:hypothetical protein
MIKGEVNRRLIQGVGVIKTIGVKKLLLFVYHVSRKRELKTRPIYECRCDERLKTNAEKSTRLAYMNLFIMNSQLFFFGTFFLKISKLSPKLGSGKGN